MTENENTFKQRNLRLSWTLNEAELEWSAVRAQGAGGQNINKVSNAAHLRFNIPASSLPDAIKEKLLACRDTRISAAGDVVIKAQSSRSLQKNRADALARLCELIEAAAQIERPRRPTRPTLASKTRRLESKSKRSGVKAQRGRVKDH